MKKYERRAVCCRSERRAISNSVRMLSLGVYEDRAALRSSSVLYATSCYCDNKSLHASHT